MNTPTPETDGQFLSIEGDDSCCEVYIKTQDGIRIYGKLVSAEFARKLEREWDECAGPDSPRWNNSRAKRVAEGVE